MISNYKYVLLDVDGVVLSSTDYYIDLFRDIAESLGAPKGVSNDYYKKHVGVKIITWMTDIVPKKNHHKIRDMFFAKNTDTVKDRQFPMIEGTKETLLKIKERNQKTCFISTKSREALNLMMQYYKLNSIIDYSISGDEVKNVKPDPEGIIIALKYFNAKPDQAIFIGDSLHDLGAARNANVEFIGVLTGICTRSDWELEKVLYVPSIKQVYTI